MAVHQLRIIIINEICLGLIHLLPLQCCCRFSTWVSVSLSTYRIGFVDCNAGYASNSAMVLGSLFLLGLLASRCYPRFWFLSGSAPLLSANYLLHAHDISSLGC